MGGTEHHHGLVRNVTLTVVVVHICTIEGLIGTNTLVFRRYSVKLVRIIPLFGVTLGYINAVDHQQSEPNHTEQPIAGAKDHSIRSLSP